MSIESLCKVHQAVIYNLASTQDAGLQQVESLGSATKKVWCRFVPLSVKEKAYYEQGGLTEMYRVMFAADPELTADKCLVWNSKVWRLVEYQNNSMMSWMWSAVVQHLPQVEIPAS